MMTEAWKEAGGCPRLFGQSVADRQPPLALKGPSDQFTSQIGNGGQSPSPTGGTFST